MFGAEQFPKVNTGTDLVISSSSMMTTTSGSATAQPMSPMETMKEVFFDIRDSLQAIVANTLETNELLKVGVLGTPADQRRESIERAETDSQGNLPPVETDEGGPGFLDRLKGLNPFKSGIGTFGKVLLALLGLGAIKFFKEPIAKGFASFLEFISDLGNSDSAFNKKFEEIKIRAETAFNEFKDGVEKTVEFIKRLNIIIKKTYESIETYINTFDVDPDDMEGLNKEEIQNLKDDVQDKITTAIAEGIGKLISKIKDEIVGIFAFPVTLGLAITAIKNSILGKDGVDNDLKKKKPGKFKKVLGKVGLIAAIGLGVIELIDKSKEAYADAITDEMGNKQSFDFSELIGNFFGGDGKGIFNSFGEMFKMGAIGTAVGAGIGLTLAKAGFVLGTPFGPIGMATGALAGFLFGSIIGAVGGFFGGEAISNLIDGIGDFVLDTATSISNFFKDFISSIKDTLGIGIEGMDTQEELDEGLADVNKNIEKVAGRNMGPANVNRLNKLRKDRDKILDKIDAQTLNDTDDVNLSDIDKKITARNSLITLLSNKSKPTKADQEMIGIIQSEIDALREEKNVIKGIESLNPANFVPNAPGGLAVFGPIQNQNRIASVVDENMIANAPGGVPVIQQNNSVDNSTAVASSNVYTHPLAANNSYLTAMMAHRNKLMMG